MNLQQWIYHSPTFESDEWNLEMMKYSPWSGHRLFAYDYVCNIKPQCIVELGSYYGCSSFTFLQAIKDKGLDTLFYAIDTWAGDSFTKNDYVENIYEEYQKLYRNCFSAQKAYVLRMTFDEAVKKFEDNTIDLLHIDGSHNYEDVKHDFELWKGKVKNNGVIFFHDIGEDELFGKKMGSHLFWEEIKTKYGCTVEFPFSFGLGILFLNEKNWRKFINAIDNSYYQKQVNFAESEYKDSLRKDFFVIRDQKKYIKALTEQIEVQKQCMADYESTTDEKNSYIKKLEDDIKALLAENASLFRENKRINLEYQVELEKYKENINGKEQYILELQQGLSKYELNVKEKNEYITSLEKKSIRVNK